ncbi:MAG TPA: hypothetical protein HA257_09350 [Candidatus Methanoperedenaceae archaeon]|nr:hypothetical protein [Candidatus Methanoperedenaceae archaeon]
MPETQQEIKTEAAEAEEKALNERLGWKPEFAEPGMQSKAFRKMQEDFQARAQNPFTISDYSVLGITPSPPEPSPLPIPPKMEFWLTLDKETTESLLTGGTIRLLRRGESE